MHVRDIEVSNGAVVYNVLMPYTRKRQEHFIVLTLNGAHKIIRKYVVTVGLVNRTIIAGREVYWPAVKDNAQAIIVAHNHPAGITKPSSDDDEVTRMLREAGHVLGIRLLDHVIVTRQGYYSYAQAGRLSEV